MVKDIANGDHQRWRGWESLHAYESQRRGVAAGRFMAIHRKGQFWVQFGGHIESKDASVAEAAQREAREESGIGDLVLLSPAIVDLDRHDLHAGFSCTAHWDVGFAAAITPDAEISVSDESEDVRWFPINDLPTQVPAGFSARLERARRTVMLLTRAQVG